MSESVKKEFDNKINRLSKSKAYLDYCDQVYGYRMYLFNMMDKEQLDFVFNDIPISCNDTVLDVGCGCGSILKAISEKSGCTAIGCDQLSSDTAKSQNEIVKYLNGDFDNISKYHLHPTVTLLIDSIYFSRDPEKLIRYLYSIKNNRIYLFYSQYLFKGDTGDKSKLDGDFTTVAWILKENGIPYKFIDYSENERMLYDRSLEVLDNMKGNFEAEGNKDLYEDKVKEQMMGKELYDGGNASRFLYVIGEEE